MAPESNYGQEGSITKKIFIPHTPFTIYHHADTDAIAKSSSVISSSSPATTSSSSSPSPSPPTFWLSLPSKTSMTTSTAAQRLHALLIALCHDDVGIGLPRDLITIVADYTRRRVRVIVGGASEGSPLAFITITIPSPMPPTTTALPSPPLQGPPPVPLPSSHTSIIGEGMATATVTARRGLDWGGCTEQQQEQQQRETCDFSVVYQSVLL